MELPQSYSKSSPSLRRLIREEYRKIQDDKCWFCKQPLTGEPHKEVLEAPLLLELFPPNFLKHPIHLHHSHETDLTIGAVHARCNGYLWQYLGE